MLEADQSTQESHQPIGTPQHKYHSVNHNIFEDSISLIEKTALKYIPILSELMRKLVKEKGGKMEERSIMITERKEPRSHLRGVSEGLEDSQNNISGLDVDDEDEEMDVADMHNILGYLN